MGRKCNPTAEDLLRLDEIAKYLKIKSRFGEPTFREDAIAAGLAKVAPLIRKSLPCTGEDIALRLGESLCVTFEEVYGPDDITAIKDRYLRGKKEIGFAQLSDELQTPGVDALLFQRMHAQEHEADRWVAVLNLQESQAKAYWNRFHELSHRIAEPPQKILPLRRHKFEASNAVEALIDSLASEVAFYGPAFQPLVLHHAKLSRLSIELIETIRREYAPTASLLATIKATVKYWPGPAAALTAEFRGRRNSSDKDRALRVSLQGYSNSAKEARLTIWDNMRAPLGSPVHDAFATGLDQEEYERLSDWITSTGACLAPINIYTSARRIRNCVYAVMST